MIRRKDLWSCFISIFFALFSLMGIAATLTAHLVQDYEYDATVAYYLFAVWSSGHIIGSFAVTCMIPYTRIIIRVAMAVHVVGLFLAGPSNLASSLFKGYDTGTILKVNSVGLFLMGLTAAALQSLGNIESVTRA